MITAQRHTVDMIMVVRRLTRATIIGRMIKSMVCRPGPALHRHDHAYSGHTVDMIMSTL